jgi:hypothetical protein
VILQLLEYRIVLGREAEVTGRLRHSVEAEKLPPGMVARCLGRRLGPQGPEHIAITAWRDRAALNQGTEGGAPRFIAPRVPFLSRVTSSLFTVVADSGTGCRGARVLRVYRATIMADAIDLWTRRIAAPARRVAAMEGILVLNAGVSLDQPRAQGETPVVVVTAWKDWDSLLLATGGRLNDLLLDTGMEDLERPLGVDHYEWLEPEPLVAG